MSLWVSLGTLIDYYNALHGPLFFLYLNTAFYAPGLPISYFQMVFDQKYDARYGAGRTWAFRIGEEEGLGPAVQPKMGEVEKYRTQQTHFKAF